MTNIFGGERLLNLDDEGGVFKSCFGTVCGAIAEPAVLASQLPRIFAFQKNGAAQTDAGGKRRLPSKLRREVARRPRRVMRFMYRFYTGGISRRKAPDRRR